jgi:purine-binding chemotaxis protein CheW
MTNPSYLTFSVQGLLLAVDTAVVREIVWLPNLTVLAEYPSSIAGAFNLRGTIVPVMDLTLRFGRPPQRYNLSDRVIIMSIPENEARGRKRGPRLLGIIVHDVHGVTDIGAEEIERPPFPEREMEPHPFFVQGAAKVDEKIVMILDPVKILDFDFTLEDSVIENPVIGSGSANGSFCPEAVPVEKETFQRRALEFWQALDREDPADLIPVAVIGLNGESLCVELKTVREFSKLRNFTPVPCCPKHVVGNMNLRGNVLTLIDIRTLLNMQAGRPTESTKVMVADAGDIQAGVVVDELFDVIYLKPADLTPLSSDAGAIGEKFIKGTVFYGNRMMAMLDLEKILDWEGLAVNEEP